MRETGRTVFEPRTVAAVVAAGVVAFGLFLVLLAFAGELRGSGSDGRAHALSNSAVGFRGLVRLIELGGGRARIVRTPAELATEDLLVVVAEERTDPAALESLLEARPGRATLVILPKWDVIVDPARRGWVRRLGLKPDLAIEDILEGIGPVALSRRRGPSSSLAGTDFLHAFRAAAPETMQTAAGKTLTPLVPAGDGALVARIGDGPHYLLADPDLLNNQGLRDARAARAALTLLAELSPGDARSIAFDLTLNGFAERPSALRLAFEPPFLPLTLVLFAAALLAGLHGAVRFGAAADEAPAIPFGKSALVENSASLFRIARREHRVGGAYAELVREAAAHDSGAHLALRDAELDAYLDRLSPPGKPSFGELADKARRAANRFELIAAARALFQWKKDLIK